MQRKTQCGKKLGATRDVHLKPGCDAIDAGTLDLAPLEDAAGAPRPQGQGIDFGAYEFCADQ